MGTIAGTPTTETDEQTYTVTAKNDSGETSAALKLAIEAPADGNYVDSNFCNQIDEVTDLAKLMEMEPAKDKAYGNWMVWMVHRVHLNDPTLKELNFSSMIMPMPKVEWRVAPKLMDALQTNTQLEQLLLGSSNLRRTQGPAFAEALGKNTTLRIVDVAANDLDTESIKAAALALKDNTESKLETWRFASNGGMTSLGAPTEEALNNLLKTNKTISTLGCALMNPGYRDTINRALLRNGDLRRRARKAGAAGAVAPATKKTLKALVLNDPPTDHAAWEVFAAENEQLNRSREYLAEHKAVPNNQALQNYMKKVGVPLKFSEVGPLLKDVRGKLLDANKEHDVCCLDTGGMETKGVLKSWTQVNKTWNLEIAIGSKRYNFETTSDPEIRMDEKYAKWLS